MNTKKRLLSFVLSLALLLSLAACGKKQKTEAEETPTYLSEVISVQHGLHSVEATCIAGGYIYLLGYKSERFDSPRLLLRVPEGSDQAEELPDYQPVVADTHYDYCWLQEAADGTILEAVMLDESNYWTSVPPTYVLRRLDKNGKELSRLDIEDLKAPDGRYFHIFAWDGQGNVWTFSNNTAAALDEEGNVLFTLPFPQEVHIPDFEENAYNVYPTTLLGDGRLGVKLETMSGGSCLYVLDREGRKWEEPIRLGNTQITAKAYAGDDSALYYIQSANSLYAWREETGERERIADLLDTGIDEDTLSYVLAKPDGRLFLVCYDSFSGSLQTASLTPAQEDRTVLTMAA